MGPTFARAAARAVFLAAILAAAGSTATAAADDYKPLVVVSAASYERALADFNAVTNPFLTNLVVHALQQALGTPVSPNTLGPLGLDTRRPAGLVVETDGQSFPIYGFFPVTNLQGLLAGSVAAGKLKAPVEGVYEFEWLDRKWYLAQKGPWAFFATSRHGLETAPADPVKMLAGLNNSYDLAAKVYVENLPDNVRQGAKWYLKEGGRLALPRERGETDLWNALRTALTNQGLHLAASLADEGDVLLLGASMDLRTRALVLDLEITAQTGSTMAESLRAPSKSKTDFSGFLVPNAALSGNWIGENARMPLYELLTLFDSVSGELLPGLSDPAVSEFWKAAEEAMMEESVDGGVAASIRQDGVTLTVGAYVPDSTKLDEKIKAMAEAARAQRADGQAPAWKLNAARYGDVHMHALSIPIPKDAKDRLRLVRMFGPSLEVVVGIGEHSVYVAAGKNPVQAIKHVMGRSQVKTPRKQPPLQFTAAMAPAAALLAETAPDNQRMQAVRLAVLLQQSGGRDHVRLVAYPIERGTHFRLEVEEGVLRCLQSLNQPAPARPGLRPVFPR